MLPEDEKLLSEIIQTSMRLHKNIDMLYKNHDHEVDLQGGALISSLRALIIALEDGSIAYGLHLAEKGKTK